MTGGSAWLVKLAASFVACALAFWLGARWNRKVAFARWWALPPVALVFAVLDTALYWAMSHLLAIATLGVMTFALPLLSSLVLLAITLRVFQGPRWVRVEGVLATLWLALALTLAHGAVWVALDYLPRQL
jgi:hypothetical protein